ncbi:unnamed protein product [Paramecium pentaurelia]|uniref:EF-hand domain-containing protein n=1 Tax=Paramecium pentaurelia TaxID=43138 RepID=A0A8S1W5S9_9CILI|nr:unnamed protein product [Paramecium pentaurelia]
MSRANKQVEQAPAQNKQQKGAPSAKPSKPKENYLTPEEINDLKETFDLFDDDKSGTIDAHEIKKVLEDLGVDARNKFVYQMVQDLENFGGSINFDTFVEIISNRLGNNKTREGAQKLFQIYDPEDTGFIDFTNLKRVAKELGETLNDDELHEMIHHIHILRKTESPEQISFEEFYEIITAPRRY